MCSMIAILFCVPRNQLAAPVSRLFVPATVRSWLGTVNRYPFGIVQSRGGRRSDPGNRNRTLRHAALLAGKPLFQFKMVVLT